MKDLDKFTMKIEDNEAEVKGIKDKMPIAIEVLKGDERLVEALGPDIVERCLKVEIKEEEAFSHLTWLERIDTTTRIL